MKKTLKISLIDVNITKKQLLCWLNMTPTVRICHLLVIGLGQNKTAFPSQQEPDKHEDDVRLDQWSETKWQFSLIIRLRKATLEESLSTTDFFIFWKCNGKHLTQSLTHMCACKVILWQCWGTIGCTLLQSSSCPQLTLVPWLKGRWEIRLLNSCI